MIGRSVVLLLFWASQFLLTLEFGFEGWILLLFQTLLFMAMTLKIAVPSEIGPHLFWRWSFCSLMACILAYSFSIFVVTFDFLLSFGVAAVWLKTSIPTFLVCWIVWLNSESA